jgi:hypothetical protein
MKNFFTLPIAVLLSTFVTNVMASDLPRTDSVVGAKAYIVSPSHGAVVDSTFTVVFGLSGMGVAPAGIDKAKTGHHHLLVNNDMLPPDNIPMGTQVTHFGGGQTETTVTLEPGEHTLQIILGDKFHVQHNPPIVSQQITVTVK